MASLISFTPIGIVCNAIRESHRETRWEEIESEIVIDAKWRDALAGIEEFSHLWVIVALDRMPAPDALRIRPMKRDDLPVVGIFATRSPQRQTAPARARCWRRTAAPMRSAAW